MQEPAVAGALSLQVACHARKIFTRDTTSAAHVVKAPVQGQGEA